MSDTRRQLSNLLAVVVGSCSPPSQEPKQPDERGVLIVPKSVRKK
jgi:hypothetical protein